MGVAEDVKKLGEDIVASYDLRVKFVSDMVEETGSLMNQIRAEQKNRNKEVADLLEKFAKDHETMSNELKKTLSEGEAVRLEDFKTMKSGIQKYVDDVVKETKRLMGEIQARKDERNKEVADLLEKFAKDHETMSNELKKTLSEGEAVRLEDFKTMKSGIQKYVDDVVKETKRLMGEIQARKDERNKEVFNLLQECKSEREKMAANWQALNTAMAKRRGVKPKVEAEVKVRPVEEAIEETKETKVATEIELEEKVLEFIERHPEGVKVGDIEEPLGVPRMRLGQVAKRLLKKGEVRKEGNIYFPI